MEKENSSEAYRLSVEDAISENQSRSEGLNSTEILSKFEQYGPNKFIPKKKDPIAIRFFRQFKDLMLILLLLSSAFSLFIDDIRTAVVLIVIVLINAIIGFSQEFKAERVMESLEKLVVAKAKVKRDGVVTEIDTEQLVPGDILLLEEGDSVPADARVIEENELSTNDFALTGESNPSRKFTHAMEGSVQLALRHNLVFMGTTVATGNATCLVVATGMQTELGRIASLSTAAKTDASPLQKEMTNLARTITLGTIVLGTILALIEWRANAGLRDTFIFAIGIASAMIPQGLPAEVNTALAAAAGRLAKEKALVKKLSSVETLGSTSVILTDKTGTLTKNEMTVQKLWIDNQVYQVTGTGYEATGEVQDDKGQNLSEKQTQNFSFFFLCGLLATNAKVHPPDDDHPQWYCLGDPTEGAIVTLAQKNNLNQTDTEKLYKELRELPFDSARKRMSSIREWNNGVTAFCKGAPEEILKACTHIWDGQKTRVLTDAERQKILAQNELWATEAMRNLAFAVREIKGTPTVDDLTIESVEKDLTFLGLVSMIDPPRTEVPDAMKVAQEAHIPVSIITGDNALTAKAIAVRSGLAASADELHIVVGDELPLMSDADILTLVLRGKTIFSRVAPEDKLRIVEITKKSGHVVAVTGDGINDAPALKRADIGVAMGKTGTDVAKQSAEIVLLDDSFHTLVNAVRYGRVIYQNIRKAALSAITSNAGELAVVLLSLLALTLWKIPIAIGPIQILAIDLIAELFPIAALGWDPGESDLIKEKPRNLHDHILNRYTIFDLIWTGILMGGLAYIAYLLAFTRNGVAIGNIDSSSLLYAKATTITYLTICLSQFGNIMLRRIKPGHKFFTSYLWSNPKIFAAFGISVSIMLALIYVPLLQPYFGTASLGFVDWLYPLAFAIVFLFVRQSILKLTHKSARITAITPQ